MAEDSSEVVREMTEASAATNVKVVSEGPSFFQNLAYGNAVAHQQAMQNIQAAAVGNIVKGLTEVDTLEALSVLKATSGNDLAQQLSALLAAISTGQQGAKTADRTPPVGP